MQFAGQRTTMFLEPIGEPINELIRLTPDILPEPEAVLLTGITPQATLTDGLTEADFLKLFYKKAVIPDTIFVGYNSIRFDDEFMRFLNYRNFYDPYEWHWDKRCSRWDLLDVVRMTRALRPEGVKWPYTSDGKPTNRLADLAQMNKLVHENAHDALSDVTATIALTRLIQQKQPELFRYLLRMRGKRAVAQLVTRGQPFVYTSGHFSSQSLHTTAVVYLADHPRSEAALVYDLRYDPTPFVAMNVDELVNIWRYKPDREAPRLPVKTLKYNRCPMIAPLGVIKDAATEERLNLSLDKVQLHWQLLKQYMSQLSKNVLAALDYLDEEQMKRQATLVDNPLTVDEQLYERFLPPEDKPLLKVIRQVAPSEIREISAQFQDNRMQLMAPLYMARNYPASLSLEERAVWDAFRKQKLLGGKRSQAAQYFVKLSELAESRPDKQQQYLIEELRLYGESILPVEDAIG
jgi:exodeoxyribonuclease-1